MNSTLFRTFLGIDRLRELFSELNHQSQNGPQASWDSVSVLLALTIGILPALAPLVTTYRPFDIATVLIGLATVFAILFRIAKGLHFKKHPNWKKSLHITHTAFALGCIPTVVIILVYPEAFLQVGSEIVVSGARKSAEPGRWDYARFVFLVSVWAALTEEFVFRGLVLSALRRWRAIPSQKTRDVLAVLISALWFSLGHLGSWGPIMGLALFGLGIGFGLAYLAIGELLLPVILYHAIFDALSLSFAWWSMS